jgi:hypothetical protein
MFEGTVISINITPIREGPLQSVNEVRAVPGRGLEAIVILIIPSRIREKSLPWSRPKRSKLSVRNLRLTSISAELAAMSLPAACL